MTEEKINELTLLPVVPLRGIVLFPDMTLHFDIGRKSSLAALKAAGDNASDLFFVTQRDINKETPGAEDLYPVGVVGSIRQIIRLPDHSNTLRVIVDGKYRAEITEIAEALPYIKAEIRRVDEDYTLPEQSDGVTVKLFEEAAVFSVRQYFDDYCEHVPQMPPDIIGSVYEEKRAGRISDLIAENVMFSMEDKQDLLGERNIFIRTEKLCAMLAKETEILILDEAIQDKVQEQMDKNQREYYLREQMKIIGDELNDIDGEDTTGLLAKIKEAKLPEDNRQKLLAELDRMKKMQQTSPDANVIRTYIEKCLEIPWGIFTTENKNIQKAQKILDRDHYGLKDVKERITELLAARIVSPDIKGQIICLAGPPGVGKTSVAKSIAAATNLKYVRISLGGVRDEAEIRGHRKTYIGAMPGRIVNALIEAGSQNPLILLDEVDKLGGDFRGDPSSALLEVLDGEQNFSFRDHYIELPLDLSKALFITTANDKNAIPDALRDRMEIIDLPSYTYEEKFRIAKKHLLPKQLKEHGLNKTQLKISDNALREIIDGYTREAGVRVLERQIAKICRKESVRIAVGNSEKLDVTDKNLESLLGVKRFRPEENKHQDTAGLVNGLAWTSVGGEMLEVEALVLDGTGKLELTGSLGDVMKESAKAALSFIRSRADKLGIASDFYKTKDIHIHFPEGAVPKDGPSAGVTVTTCLVSALTGRKVRGDVAMTGEVTLRGRVLAIGGLREKSMAAYREGMKYVLIPDANVPDLQEVDPAVKEKVSFIPVKSADEALRFALLPKEEDITAANKKNTVKRNVKIPDFNVERGRTGELQ